MDSLLSAAKRLARNQDVEEKIALKALGGEKVDVPSIEDVTKEGAGMHLGDINHPQPLPIIINNPAAQPSPPAPQSSILGPLMTMALGAALGGGGLALGQLLNRPAPVIQQPADPGETVNLGLGRIEDYLKGK